MYFIKSYHAPGPAERKRVHFWQCPWVVINEDGVAREVGGWVTWSGAATIYPDPEEAKMVNAIRYLNGEVVNAGPYLQTPA